MLISSEEEEEEEEGEVENESMGMEVAVNPEVSVCRFCVCDNGTCVCAIGP